MTEEQMHKWITIEVSGESMRSRATSHYVIHYNSLLELQDGVIELVQDFARENTLDIPMTVFEAGNILYMEEVAFVDVPGRFACRVKLEDAYTEEQMIRQGFLDRPIGVSPEVWGKLWTEQEARKLMETIL